jgi:hypothetical protein
VKEEQMDKLFPYPIKTRCFPRLAARWRSIRHGPIVAYTGTHFVTYWRGTKVARISEAEAGAGQ